MVDPERQTAAAAVVADAVALALEEAAAESAEAALLTAAAVAGAASRAADAATSDRQARASAADAAAQSVASEVERTAVRVRRRADLAAARVQKAAVLAADELAHAIAAGTALDRRRRAELLAATVQAAADAAAQDTTLAADAVADAATAAAAYVKQTVADAEEAADSDVTATADAQRELAMAAAAAVALEANARAVGVSIMALEAADALVADQPGLRRASYMYEIAAELSHDLRVPLSSIIASMEMLEDELTEHPNQGVAALLGRAMRASDRMVRMLDHYLASHTPGQQSTRQEVDLNEIVRQFVLNSAALFEPVGAVVRTDELPVVRADSDQMYSVLQNLINNSVKFARPGVPAIVEISARRSVDCWRIGVRDNGVGLPDNSDLDVFALFSRGTWAIAGHGVGLATVARIVAMHGGRVGTTPQKTGTEIWFELPDDEPVQ